MRTKYSNTPKNTSATKKQRNKLKPPKSTPLKGDQVITRKRQLHTKRTPQRGKHKIKHRKHYNTQIKQSNQTPQKAITQTETTQKHKETQKECKTK